MKYSAVNATTAQNERDESSDLHGERRLASVAIASEESSERPEEKKQNIRKQMHR